MSISRSLAVDVVACAVLGILLWAACAGIGYQILPRRTAPRSDEDPPSWHQPGIAACAGVGALLLLGGISVLFRVPWWLVVVPFLVVGLALAIREAGHLDIMSIPRPIRVIGGLGAGALLLVALVQALVGFRFPLAACDDLRAYLPMARRLLDTNGLIEPWSTRRLQNVGGFTFLQALPVSVFGDVGVGVIETMLASIFLGGLFVANGMRSIWTRVVSIVFILVIPLLWVPRVNSTGVLMAGPLLVAAFAITAELRGSLRGGARGDTLRWAVASGLVIAALLSVRPPLGAVGALVVSAGAVAGAGVAVRSRLAAVGAVAAATVVAIIPWSVATFQSSGVFLYSLPAGNQNVGIVRDPPLDGIADLAGRAGHLLLGSPYPWIALGVLVVAFAARRLVPDAQVIGIAAVATGIVLVALALSIPFAPRLAFLRYVAPLAHGLAVFCVCEVLRGADARGDRASTPKSVRAPVLVLVASIGLAAVAYSVIGISISSQYIPGGSRLVRMAVKNEVPVLPLQTMTVPHLANAYQRALRDVEPGRTIAAVDRPYLIDYRELDIPSLDLPGFAAPGGTFPFFNGPGPKIAKLRREGYDTLIASVPDTDACLQPTSQRKVITLGLKPYNRWARYHLDWEDDVDAIVRRAPDAVHRFGPLLVIDLPRAQRDLARTADHA